MDMSLSKLEDSEEQGGLACCSPLGRKASNMTEWLSNSTYWIYRLKESLCSYDIEFLIHDHGLSAFIDFT